MTTSHRLDDGRWFHSLRQSWMGEADLCAERARANHAYPDQRRETDAACIGTACHTVFETAGQNDLDLATCVDLFHHEFDLLVQQPNFTWVKYTPKAAHKLGEVFVEHWYHDVLPGLCQDAMYEWTFRVNLVSDKERVIDLTGTADYVVRDGVRDWKTNGGRLYEEWEKRRWAIQPTIYTYAAYKSGLVDADENEMVDFEFVVMSKGGVQYVPVQRGPLDWAWLAHKATALAKLIEAELPQWPTNDNHALCSPDWCENWSRCKGAFVGLERPKNW